MDPNACLSAIRSACMTLLALIDTDHPDPHDVAEAAAALSSETQDLNEWMRRRGYAPAAWAVTAR